MPKMIKKYNIICFSFMPWSNMWKRNQSMMAEMVKFDFIDKIIFVNPAISLWQVLKNIIINGKESVKNRLFLRQVHPSVWNYILFYILPVSLQNKFFKRLESRRHLNQLLNLNGQSPFILFLNCPNILYPYPLDELLKLADLSVFDFSDDFVELTKNNKRKGLYLHNSEKYARAADVVLAVNNHLKEKYSHLNSNINVIKNGTNYKNFQKKNFAILPFLENMKRSKKPIIGYSGISHLTRIDVKILEHLFINRPDWHFVFVGRINDDLMERLSSYDNFFSLPAVKYEVLPDYLSYFDVTIVPFQINENTRGNNLLKFHDYLAMGKPVVTTNIGGAEDLKNVVGIANTPADFLNLIEHALAADSLDLIQQRKQIAFDNSWPNRIREVEKLLIQYLVVS